MLKFSGQSRSSEVVDRFNVANSSQCYYDQLNWQQLTSYKLGAASNIARCDGSIVNKRM
jgi:hypothetical protein